jgi:hypothetical protein
VAILSTAQKARVRFYLGWSARFHQFDSRLEQAMSSLEASSIEDPDTLGQITNLLTSDPPGLLAQLADVDARMAPAYVRLKAKKIASIELPEDGEIAMLRSEGRRYVGRLAALLGVEVRQDVFSGRLPRSFATARGLIPGGSGSNYPPMG